MNKREISFRGIKLKRIITAEEHENLIGELEKLFYKGGQLDLSQLPFMQVEVQNLIIDAQTKLQKNGGINLPAILFWLGAYISGFIGYLGSGWTGWVIGTVVAFCLMVGCVRLSNKWVDQYKEELLAYQTVEKLLTFIYEKHCKS